MESHATGGHPPQGGDLNTGFAGRAIYNNGFQSPGATTFSRPGKFINMLFILIFSSSPSRSIPISVYFNQMWHIGN